jgi:hypothetical protein
VRTFAWQVFHHRVSTEVLQHRARLVTRPDQGHQAKKLTSDTAGARAQLGVRISYKAVGSGQRRAGSPALDGRGLGGGGAAAVAASSGPSAQVLEGHR